MKQNYEPGGDNLFIKLVENESRAHGITTVNLSDETKPDFTKSELSLAIEILEAKDSSGKSTVQRHN